MDRRQALDLIRAKDSTGRSVPVDILYCTLDLKRKTGGELKRLKRVVPSSAMDTKTGVIRFRYLDDVKHAKKHHYPVHLPLLLEVNGNPVG